MNKAFEKLTVNEQLKIIHAGIKEFSHKPYVQASTDEIITNAQISKGLLFYYFGNKKNFYCYCLNYAAEKLTTPSNSTTHKDNDSENSTSQESGAQLSERSAQPMEQTPNSLKAKTEVPKLSAQVLGHTAQSSNLNTSDFYSIIFSTLKSKIELCKKYPNETHFLNMASKELHSDVIEQKNQILKESILKAKKESLLIYQKALSSLKIKKPDNPKILEALILYSSSIINKYLILYQDSPDDFFSKIEEISLELKEYIGFLLDGICLKEGKHEENRIG